MATATVNDSEIVPIAQFARTLKITAQAIKDWQNIGRLNRDRTKRVKIKLVKMPYGWGISQKIYMGFIQALNEESDAD